MDPVEIGERQGDPLYLIFSDLDGTLLEENTYGFEEALPAIRECRERKIPVIIATSKTRDEVELAAIRRELGTTAPFISENGGGIFFPEEGPGEIPPQAVFERGLWKLSVGVDYGILVKALREIRLETGLDLRGFSDMKIDEIAEATGLSREQSALAAKRDFDEPFQVMNKKEFKKEALLRAVARRGLSLTEGGRFFHLHGGNDKGLAMEKIVLWYRTFDKAAVSIALGDGPNDFPMLERADRPVLVTSGRSYPELKRKIPRLLVTDEKGPKGWNRAVLDILSKI